MALPSPDRYRNRILLISSDPDLPAVFERYKSHEAPLEFDHETEARVGARRAFAWPYPLVVADDGMSGMRSFELCRTLRERRPRLLLLVLCDPRGGEFDRTLALELGADDAVTRPAAPRELVARAKALLRWAKDWPGGDEPTHTAGRLRFGELGVDLTRRRVLRGSARVALSPTELTLFMYLAARPGRAVSRDELTRAVWGRDANRSESCVPPLVARLRAKIEPVPAHPRYVCTVQGVGYRLVSPGGTVERVAG